MNILRDVVLCLSLVALGFIAGWQLKAEQVESAQKEAEAQWRADFKERKQQQLAEVRKAIQEAKSDEARRFFQSVAVWIENDFK